MTWPVTPVVPGGPSGRRWPTPNRRTSIGIGLSDGQRAALAPRTLRARRIVASGSANFCVVK